MKHRYRCLASNCWFMDLVEAAKQFTTCRGHEKQTLARLAAFGARRAQTILCKSPKGSLPAFGLANFPLLFSMLEDDEQRIKILRHCAKRYRLKDSDLIIRYMPITFFSNRGTLDSMPVKGRQIYYEYASAISSCHKSLKCDHDSSQRGIYEHHCRIPGHPLTDQMKHSPNPLEVGFCACLCRTGKKLCKNDFKCSCCLDRTYPCRKRYSLQPKTDNTGEEADEHGVERPERPERKERKREAERNEILVDILDIRRAYFESIGEISFQVEKEDIQEVGTLSPIYLQ